MHDHVLVVDDEGSIRELIASQLKIFGQDCVTAASADEAYQIALGEPRPALVISDVHMPGTSGVQLLHQIKELDENIQVVMVSGLNDLETVRECLRNGAYDYLIKPFELEDLVNTVRRAIERNHLLRQNESYRIDLEAMVSEQTDQIRQTRDIAVFTLARLAESRDNETGLHLERMAEYSRRLAEELKSSEGSAVTTEYLEQLYKSSPLHDIGKVGIPDSILLKPGPLTSIEFRIMQRHTTIGGDTLRSVIERFSGQTFLTMAMEIAYSHHEKWDGSGYPHGLVGRDIPLSARVVALADAYDAITSARPYKDALDHESATERICRDVGKHFDPELVAAFDRCHEEFVDIRRGLMAQEKARSTGL